MRVLIVYPDCTAEISEVNDPSDIFDGPCVDERPFVDKTISMCRMYDPTLDIPVNEAITLRRVRGTVVFCESKNLLKYTDLSPEKEAAILNRFEKIKIKEEEKCIKTSASLWERLMRLIRGLLKIKK